ncbi:glycosyltransferase family 4 protein [Pseudarthrobacter sp. H3Y2-7]|jgi:glycosyltransferase involved in cell wall biosynthesis|uniref:glycosyltransferase family 4 protein n=1 Tax=Pseudarthrobacter naphthalenicus TaxID=3031328 RepID=UPI0023AF2E00|nr:glycosyltransferase family 4 protein [Pseudarthrobacter sp. H3Y2-7]MDE8668795.1 glycosyltransferase family 4 protein [Pseudarthrobacter sp. H3Y2-7]
MRIGLIAAPWIPIPPSGYGGIERVVDLLARGFTAAGHEVVLAAASDSTCPVPLAPGMRPSEPTEMGLSLSELSHVIRAYEGLGDDVDIIHDHTLAGPLLARRASGAPVVTTIHGPLIPSSADLYRAMAADTAIIAISRDQASLVPDVPITRVIHHGMDVAAVPVGSGQGGYACFVGRMCPDKGVVEAIQIARRAGIPLRIAAKIRERAEVEYFHSVVEPLLGPNEEFLGEIGDAEKYRLMGEAIAFLNPIQWHEPFGLVMIESLSTGTPVVGTPIGSAPEIVDDGKTGYLAVTEELHTMLPLAASLDRSHCRERALKLFSTERMVRNHLDLYAKLVEKSQAAGVPDRSFVQQNRGGGTVVQALGGESMAPRRQ